MHTICALNVEVKPRFIELFGSIVISSSVCKSSRTTNDTWSTSFRSDSHNTSPIN